MLKLLGMALLFLGSAGTGLLLSKGLARRTELLQLIERLLLALSNDLHYQKTPTLRLLREIGRDESYAKLQFLSTFAEPAAELAPISQLWDSALKKQMGLQNEELELLQETGRILGASDSESQINALSLQQKKLERILEESLQKQQTQGKLFRSMGVLCGFLLIILTF